MRERQRENHLGGARPPNLLNIALCVLVSSCLHLCPFCLCLGGRTLAPSVYAPCVYMQRQKKHDSRQARKKQRRQGEFANNILTKKAKHAIKKIGCPRRTNVGLDRVLIVPLDWSMDDTQTHACTCRHSCKDAKEAKKAKRVAPSKQGKNINIARSGERCESSTPTSQRCISQVVTPHQATRGMDVTIQVQAYGGTKHGKAQIWRG